MRKEDQALVEIVCGAYLVGMGMQYLIGGAKRRAVAQALAERDRHEQRMRDIAQEAEEHATKAREEFRDDVAAGVKAGIEDDRG